MCMIRLNSQLQQFGGFTTRRRVFGRAPQLHFGAVDNPAFNKYFTFQNDQPVIQTMNALVKLMEIQKADLQSDFQEKLNLSLRTSFRGMWT